jgi:hypothetical protein
MSRHSERPRGVTVKVLDLTDLAQEALEWRQKTRPECFKATIYGGDWAVAKDCYGTLFAICTEGVGFEVSEDEPLELEFHGNYSVTENVIEGPNPHKTTFDVLPFGSYELVPQDLLDYPVKDEMDLADFVRTFGSRLESNFWLWFKELSK